MFRLPLRAMAIAAALALASTANAQQPAPETTRPATPSAGPVATPAEKPPVAGKNSFTESQARERIQKAGFQDVKVLTLDTNGVWRADAQKSGQPVRVAMDFRGNVVQQ